MYEGTFTKLKDGSWGVRVTGNFTSFAKGQQMRVRVTKRDGTAQDKDVVVLWSGKNKFGPGGCALCKLDNDFSSDADARAASRATAGHWMCRACGEETAYSEGNRCWECGSPR